MKLQLTDRFQHALQQAYQLHHGHFRKEFWHPLSGALIECFRPGYGKWRRRGSGHSRPAA